MRSIVLALLAPAAIALTTSASAAVPAPQSRIIQSGPVTIDVAYRYARRTTVRGPRGGVYHSRTVAGRGAYGGAYAHRGVYARGGGYYGRGGVYAAGALARGGGYYGPRGVYATQRRLRARWRILRAAWRLCDQRRLRSRRRVLWAARRLCDQRRLRSRWRVLWTRSRLWDQRRLCARRRSRVCDEKRLRARRPWWRVCAQGRLAADIKVLTAAAPSKGPQKASPARMMSA